MSTKFQPTAVLLGGILFAGLASSGAAMAQSGSRIQYPRSGRAIESRPMNQGSTTTAQRGSTMRGSTTQGSGNAGSGPAGSGASGSATSGSATSGRRVVGQNKETFESKFWKYLNDARYREWAPVSGTNGDAYAGQSPHGAMLKMYLSRKAAGLPNQLPVGSVIVKENFGPDGKTLMAITTMYRANNYDSAGSGWYWTKYNPDGTVATKGGMRLAGKVQGCIDCHADAGGGDHAFFND